MINEKINDADLKLIGMDAINLNFKKEGYDLMINYLIKKLKEDGLKISISDYSKTATIENKKYDFSSDSKKERIKDMVNRAIEFGENEGLTNKTPLGEWLNCLVEYLGTEIINSTTDRIIKKIDDRIYSIWVMWGMEKDEDLKNKFLIDINKVETILNRLVKNAREIKEDIIKEVNVYVN